MLQALGNMVVVDPTPETVKLGDHTFTKNLKIAKGILRSIGSSCSKELQIGDLIFYRSGNHRQIQDLIMISQTTIVGYERAD